MAAFTLTMRGLSIDHYLGDLMDRVPNKRQTIYSLIRRSFIHGMLKTEVDKQETPCAEKAVEW
jgi:hypothetical protein